MKEFNYNEYTKNKIMDYLKDNNLQFDSKKEGERLKLIDRFISKIDKTLGADVKIYEYRNTDDSKVESIKVVAHDKNTGAKFTTEIKVKETEEVKKQPKPYLNSDALKEVKILKDECERLNAYVNKVEEQNRALLNRVGEKSETVKCDADYDVVNKPKHYHGKYECIDIIEDRTKTLKGIEAVYVSNIYRYIWRYFDKNGIEDVKKCKWYLNRLIKELEKREGSDD